MGKNGVVVMFVCQIPVILSCAGGGGWGGYNYDTTTIPSEFNLLDREDDLNRNLPGAWGGFTPPPGLQSKWRHWLNEYLEKTKMEADMPASDFKGRDAAKGWPYAWQGVGAGSGGNEPPPWAYAPINIGLPAFCYQPPKRGWCDEKLQRWAFNPYLEVCEEYVYSGCGEVQNSFKEKLKCEESCMKTPMSGCDPDTKTYLR